MVIIQMNKRWLTDTVLSILWLPDALHAVEAEWSWAGLGLRLGMIWPVCWVQYPITLLTLVVNTPTIRILSRVPIDGVFKLWWCPTLNLCMQQILLINDRLPFIFDLMQNIRLTCTLSQFKMAFWNIKFLFMHFSVLSESDYDTIGKIFYSFHENKNLK